VTLRIPGTVQLPSPSDQTDEFTHRAHTVETLARLGTASFGYLNAICAETRGPLTRIMDPFVSALLIRRTAVATGRGAALRLTTDSELPRLDPATSADVVTVLGILLENALDSVEGSEVRELTVHVDTVVAGVATPLGARVVDVRLRVHDTGPGIAGGLIDHVFEIEQITQAPVRHRADPGFGLAVVQLIATRRGGSVGYEFIDGAAFDAVLPVRPAPAVPAAAPTAD
jgi:sensor histidine kinase regulating citrate/malate metabolism